MAADGDLCARLPVQDLEDDRERLVPESAPLTRSPFFPSGRRSLAVLAAAGVAALLCWPALAWWRRAHPVPARAAHPAAGAISLASEAPNGLGGRPWEDVEVNTSAPTSFFCWTLIQIGSDEEQLLTFQWGRRMGMFQCAGWEVLADKHKHIGGEGKKGFDTVVLDGGLHDKKGAYGVACSETNGFLNSFTFMNVWVKIIKMEKVWKHDFVLKLDVDAVVFPFRLPGMVNGWRGKPVVFANHPDGHMWGSIEVFSKEALARYAADLNVTNRKDDEPAIPNGCKHLTWWCWGEDQFMQTCMKTLGVPSPFLPNLVQSGWNSGNCHDPQYVAYHKFTEVWRQEQCIKAAGQW